MARKYRKDELADGIAGEMGCFYYDKGQTEVAKQILLEVLPAKRKSGNILLCLGCIYKDEGQVDSARYYLKEVLTFGNLHKRCYANYYLAELEKAQGNEDLSLAYDNQHRVLQDSINTITQTDAVEKLHLLYNFQHEEQRNYRLALENERYLGRIYLLVFIFIVSVTLGVIVIQHIQAKKQWGIEQEKHLRLIQEEQYKKSLAYIHENELKL